MQFVLAIALLSQVLMPGRAYTTATDDGLRLTLLSGNYRIELGDGCASVVPGENVEFLVVSGSVNEGAINPIGTNELCYVTIDLASGDGEPCAQAEGVCDADLRP